MSLFRSAVHRAVWVESHCLGCWRYRSGRQIADSGCPILDRADRTDRKPVEWQRNPRGELMSDTYKCAEKASRPPRPPATEDATLPLFDITPVVDMGDHA